MMQFRLLLAAMRRYSRLPVRGDPTQSPADDGPWLTSAIRFYPLVGLIVATLTALVYAIAGLLLPHSVALLAAIAAGLLLTGALHEHGLARCCEALADSQGAPTPVGPGLAAGACPAPAPTHDTRIGTRGAAGLVLMLLGRHEALVAIDPSWVGVTLVTAAGLSRGCSAAVMLGLPAEGAGAPPNTDPMTRAWSMRDAIVALSIALAPVALAALWTGAFAVFGIATVSAIMTAAWLRKRLQTRAGGSTGERLGAVQQLSEIAFVVGALAMLTLAAESAGGEPAPAAND